MERTLVKETIQQIGNKVRVCGWVDTVRSHGKIIFIDLRDRTGILQVVFASGEESFLNQAKELRPEWVVEIIGAIGQRPEKMVNSEIATGKVEMSAEELKVFSRAKTLPFPIDTDGYEVNEEKRLKYRYLDIRRKRMQRNLRMRQKVFSWIRKFLEERDFVEVQTPLLTKSTPEGARDFIVPSRISPGNFYALPQSPQQYKQLLMVGGLERYFQFAPCLRDEDPRGDRQPEFTQLDMEMSFAGREEVMAVTEELFTRLVKELFPEKKFTTPFPRMTYQEAMAKHKSDKPDIRKDKNNPDELAFLWVIDFPFFEKEKDGSWTFTHNPFSCPQSEFMDDLLQKKNIDKILTTQYDLVLNGMEIAGGSIRNHQPEALEAVFEIMGYEKEKIRRDFGHMLDAFSYGAPPHGGIAPGADRFLSLLLNEPNIREVIAFPKTGDFRSLMMGSPSPVSKEQLDELHLEIKKAKKKG